MVTDLRKQQILHSQNTQVTSVTSSTHQMHQLVMSKLSASGCP